MEVSNKILKARIKELENLPVAHALAGYVSRIKELENDNGKLQIDNKRLRGLVRDANDLGFRHGSRFLKSVESKDLRKIQDIISACVIEREKWFRDNGLVDV